MTKNDWLPVKGWSLYIYKNLHYYKVLTMLLLLKIMRKKIIHQDLLLILSVGGASRVNVPFVMLSMNI